MSLSRMHTNLRSLKFKIPLCLSLMLASMYRSGSLQSLPLSYVHSEWLWAEMASHYSGTSIHLAADGSISSKNMFLYSPLLMCTFEILALLSSLILMPSSNFQLQLCMFPIFDTIYIAAERSSVHKVDHRDNINLSKIKFSTSPQRMLHWMTVNAATMWLHRTPGSPRIHQLNRLGPPSLLFPMFMSLL